MVVKRIFNEKLQAQSDIEDMVIALADHNGPSFNGKLSTNDKAKLARVRKRKSIRVKPVARP